MRSLSQIIGLIHKDRARRARQPAGEFNLQHVQIEVAPHKLSIKNGRRYMKLLSKRPSQVPNKAIPPNKAHITVFMTNIMGIGKGRFVEGFG